MLAGRKTRQISSAGPPPSPEVHRQAGPSLLIVVWAHISIFNSINARKVKQPTALTVGPLLPFCLSPPVSPSLSPGFPLHLVASCSPDKLHDWRLLWPCLVCHQAVYCQAFVRSCGEIELFKISNWFLSNVSLFFHSLVTYLFRMQSVNLAAHSSHINNTLWLI